MKSEVRSLLSASVLAIFGAFAVAACSGEDGAEPLDNGVNDVRLACQQRASYTNPTGEKCIQCLTVAPLENCKCEAFEGFGGACEEQGKARRAEPSCTQDIDDCVRKCDAKDCGCVDGCYAGKDACKHVTDAQDGCVAKVCEKFCTLSDDAAAGEAADAN